MNETLRKEYESKLTTAAEAVKLVRSGDTVFIGASSSVAYALCDALGEREDELEDVVLTSSQVIRPIRIMSGKNPKAFRARTFFMSLQERNMYNQDLADFTTVHLSQVDIFFNETAPTDVAFFEVSLPDENGYMSYGANNVSLGDLVKQKARNIILQVNKHAPYVLGEKNLIHVSEADAIVEADVELVELPGVEVDDTINTISDYILDQIPDGACLQLGLGGVASAVGFGLTKKNDLGAHTELMTDSMMELMKMGVMNNSRKSYMPGKTVASFAFGSKEMYQFLDHNEDMYFMPFTDVNNPVNIAKNDNMISINTAMSIDLFGQVCADNIAGRQYSATGGQVDFVRGAQMSKGGKSFIAITSTMESKKTGRGSRIVSRFPVGTAVTTLRSDVQYVVTEYGCVNLKRLSMRERALAMISLAHPDFRPQLMDEAKEARIL